MKGLLGYGRYDDDPEHVGCPRAASDMTPCVARDGQLAVADDGKCVDCDRFPAVLLKALVAEVTQPVKGSEEPKIFAGLDDILPEKANWAKMSFDSWNAEFKALREIEEEGKGSP